MRFIRRLPIHRRVVNHPSMRSTYVETTGQERIVEYVDNVQLIDLLKTPGCVQTWSFHGRISSAKVGKILYKSMVPFRGTPTADVGAFLETCHSAGFSPSSFSDAYHRLFPNHRRTSGLKSVNAWTAYFCAGGWETAIEHGLVKEHLYKYDLNSAYAWAASTAGLPDMAHIRPARKLNGLNSVTLCEFLFENCLAPYPFQTGWNRNIISGSEFAVYHPNIRRVVAAAEWEKTVDLRPNIEMIFQLFPRDIAKKILRSFWGRWMSREPVTCQTYRGGKLQKTWTLPTRDFNPLWAHLIISRVKLKVWQTALACGAVHIFVDSIIGRKCLQVGDQIGDWKFVESYQKGLDVQAPGRYISLETGAYIKQAGLRLKLFEEVQHGQGE